MRLKLYQKAVHQIDNLLSLKDGNFEEAEFEEYKLAQSQRLLNNFFDMALTGISAAFIYRLIFLPHPNAWLDLIYPFIIFLFVFIMYYVNYSTGQMKHYFHVVCIPIVGILTAKKTMVQHEEHFYLNESFASWILMMLFGAFSSSMQWYSVVTINCFCFIVYIIMIFRYYGVKGIGNDFYIHITNTIIMSACLIRMNEVNLRKSFSLLNQSKIQEEQWQRVLTTLTDGVLIMEHTNSDNGILLINPSLLKIFGRGNFCNGVGILNGEKQPASQITRKKSNLDQIVQVEPQGNIQPQSGGPCQFTSRSQQVGLVSVDQKLAQTPQNKHEGEPISKNLQGVVGANGQSKGNLSADRVINNQEARINMGRSPESQKQGNCASSAADKKNEQEPANRRVEQEPINRRIYQDKDVGPIFNELFRNVSIKVETFGQSSYTLANGESIDIQNRHEKGIQFLNDFICKQMVYWKQKKNSSGERERLFMKVYDPNKKHWRTIELNMVKLDNESQVLFLFKEVSIYNRLSKARTTERFTNLLINSIAHNLFSPLNALIHLNKTMAELIVEGQNEVAQENGQMIGQCLQQLVFTSHNILEMSKIRQGKFTSNDKEIKVLDKLDQIFDFFKEDMKFRQIDYDVKIDPILEKKHIRIDDFRFEIALYNLVSNSVKHTNGGHIKVSLKLLDQEQMNAKNKKLESRKMEMDEKKKIFLNIEQAGSQSDDDDDDEDNSLSSFESRMMSTNKRKHEQSYQIDGDSDIVSASRQKKCYYLSVSVSDSGCGMDEQKQKNCFVLFGIRKFRKNINQGGMGLGLTAANLICKALNGNLNLIRSEKDVGTKFNFTMQIQLGSQINTIEKTTEIKESDKGSCSPQASPLKEQAMSAEDPRKLADFKNRQTSLCWLERTLMASQQEFNMGQQSDQQRYEFDDYGEEEEEEDVEEEADQEEEEGDVAQTVQQNSMDTSNLQNIQNVINTQNANDIKNDTQKKMVSRRSNIDMIKSQLLTAGDVSSNDKAQQNSSETNAIRKQQKPVEPIRKNFDFKLRKKAQVHTTQFISEVDSEVDNIADDPENEESEVSDLDDYDEEEEENEYDINDIDDEYDQESESNKSQQNQQIPQGFIKDEEAEINKIESNYISLERKQGQHKSKQEGSNRQIKKSKQDGAAANHTEDSQFSQDSFIRFMNNSKSSQNKEEEAASVVSTPKLPQQQRQNLRSHTEELRGRRDSYRDSHNLLGHHEQQHPSKKQMILQNTSKNKIEGRMSEINNNYSYQACASSNLNHMNKNPFFQTKHQSQKQKVPPQENSEVLENSRRGFKLQKQSRVMRASQEPIKGAKIHQDESAVGLQEEEADIQICNSSHDHINFGENNTPDYTNYDQSAIRLSENTNIELQSEQRQNNNNIKLNESFKQEKSQFDRLYRKKSKPFKIQMRMKNSSDQLTRISAEQNQGKYNYKGHLKKAKRRNNQQDLQNRSPYHSTEQGKNELMNLVAQGKRKQKLSVSAFIEDDRDDQYSDYDDQDDDLEEKDSDEEISDSRRPSIMEEERAEDDIDSESQTSNQSSDSSLRNRQPSSTISLGVDDNTTIDHGKSQFTNKPIINSDDNNYVNNSEGGLKNSNRSTNRIKPKLPVPKPGRIQNKPNVNKPPNKKLNCNQSKTSKISESVGSINSRSINNRVESFSDSQETSQLPPGLPNNIDDGPDRQLRLDGGPQQQDQGAVPILIVDDTVFNIYLLKSMIEKKFKVKTDSAISGEEAIMMCSQRIARGQDAYRLTIMDIHMPPMDGVETTSKIREFMDDYAKNVRKQKHYMIVAHTAMPEDQFGDYREKGFDGFLQKAQGDDRGLMEYLQKVDLI